MFAKFLGLVTLFTLCSCINAQKIPVSLYYESLCPDSQKFINTQLYPFMKTSLGKSIDLTLIPYGKSNYTTIGSDVNFMCHHGPNECYGNKVHACAIKNIQGTSFKPEQTRDTLTIDYINCLMDPSNRFPDSVYPGEKCARSLELENWDVIASCANSTEGSKLLEGYGKMTGELVPKLSSVPTITFRSEFEPEVNALAQTDFRTAVCSKMTGQAKPIECGSLPGSADHVQGGVVMGAAVLISLAALF